MRSMPAKTSKQPTPAQIRQRAAFKMIGDFIRPLKDILQSTFGSAWYGEGIKINMPAVVGNEASDLYLNYEGILLGKSNLGSIKIQSVVITAKEISVSWQYFSPYASARAMAILLIYSPELQEWHFSEAGKVLDEENEVQTTLPGSFIGQTLHAYLFISDLSSRKTSASYLGCLQCS